MSTRRTNVRGIIFRDGKLLVTKYRQKNGSESEHWGTFGGGLDIGESIEAGLHREMIEETGIAPKIGRLLFIQQFHDGEKELFELFLHIENAEDYEKIELSSTTHGLLELTQSEFLDPKTNFILPTFLSEIDIEMHINDGAPVVVHNYLS